LIKSERNPVTGANEIKEVYRIQVPGNPVLGEGKPENQNHAMIFARGEFLQAIDMNQSNSFEEALKMRNLLEEFDAEDASTTPDRVQVASAGAPAATIEQRAAKRVAIVGFREHIYTGGLSSVANYMATQESTFVTQGQRVLDNPLRVRFHYGQNTNTIALSPLSHSWTNVLNTHIFCTIYAFCCSVCSRSSGLLRQVVFHVAWRHQQGVQGNQP